jgi:hypothetical protein
MSETLASVVEELYFYATSRVEHLETKQELTKVEKEELACYRWAKVCMDANTRKDIEELELKLHKPAIDEYNKFIGVVKDVPSCANPTKGNE